MRLRVAGKIWQQAHLGSDRVNVVMLWQVHVRVKIPTKLKPEERTLVEDLKALQDKKDKDRNKGPAWPFGGRK